KHVATAGVTPQLTRGSVFSACPTAVGPAHPRGAPAARPLVGERNDAGRSSWRREHEVVRTPSRQPPDFPGVKTADLDEPPDGVGEGFWQGAGRKPELVAGSRIVAPGGAVHDPYSLGIPRDPRPHPTLNHVRRAAECRQEPGWKGHEPDPTTREVTERA